MTLLGNAAKTVALLLCTAYLGYVLFAYFEVHSPQTTSVSTDTITFAANATGLPGQSRTPLRLLIPAINVDTSIQHVGLTSGDRAQMEVPSNFTDVGWYTEGPQPGIKGSAVIAGHYKGKRVPKAVFYYLDTLQIGDTVLVESAENTTFTFRVVAIKTYDYNNATDDIFTSNDGKVRLNLITCGGTWRKDLALYDQRTVVYTELVEPS